MPEQLSALTALTRLDLSDNSRRAGGWQHLIPLTQLQDLYLSGPGLTAVPEHVSALIALTRLDLSAISLLDIGWRHLVPLTQLRNILLNGVPLPGLKPPPELATLPHFARVLW